MLVYIDGVPQEFDSTHATEVRIPTGAVIRVWDRAGKDTARQSVESAAALQLDRIVNPQLYTQLKGSSWTYGRSADESRRAGIAKSRVTKRKQAAIFSMPSEASKVNDAVDRDSN